MTFIPLSLPKITEKIIEDFADTGLIEWVDGEGMQWSQDAVDFACLLNGEAQQRREGDDGMGA